MENLALGDGDMSEFEKLADRLEFENKQYVKMIEKENQCISSLHGQIEKNKEMIQRVEGDISRMDEDTMRLHKQFVQSKETLKNLKDTYNVMMDHETALAKQLESLKIKSDEERVFYQEQMTNYTNIKDEYIKKYESFPLAIELRKKKEVLSEKQKESEEMDAVITELQEKVAEKEAVLDSKVFSRMIIKIARLKLSTLQTEKEIDKCIMEKASLLEQLKDIQTTQQPTETENQEMAHMANTQDDEDVTMECEERTANEEVGITMELPQTQTPFDSSVFSVTTSKSDTAEKELPDYENSPLKPSADDGILCKNRESPLEADDKSVKTDNHDFVDPGGKCVSDVRPQVLNIPKTNQLPQTLDNYNQKPNPEKGFASRLSGISNRIYNLPQVRPVQRPVLKIPSLKPINHHKMTPKQTPNGNGVQALVPPPPKPCTVSQRLTIPTLTRSKISMPTFSMPRLLSSNRFTDTTAPLKGPAPSTKSQASTETVTVTKEQQKSFSSMAFSLPKLAKLPETPTISDSIITSYVKTCGQQSVANLKPTLGESNCKESLNSVLPNENEIITSTRSTLSSSTFVCQSQALSRSKFEASAPHILCQSNKNLDKEPSSLVFTRNNATTDDQMNAPLFKPSSNVDPMRQTTNPVQIMATQKPFVIGNDALSKQPSTPSKAFTFGSIFKPIQENNSQSPTAFSLINMGAVGGNQDRTDSETPFLSFGDSDSNFGNNGGSCNGIGGGVFSGNASNDDKEDGRPTSLLNFFNSQNLDDNGNMGASGKMFSLNFGGDDEETDKEGSFFNFSASRDNGGGKGGGFLNFRKDDDDEDSRRKESLFNIF